MPKLSIITINLNNREGLERTIQSVISQTFTDFEYIIIDGGSTDGSVDIINQFADKITCWVSEPDKGIYNAMNKGILKAKGEYTYFLNSGDKFHSNFVLHDIFITNNNKPIITGNLIRLYHDSHTEIDKGLAFERKRDNNLFTLYDFLYGYINHQATFIKKNLFEIYGLYDEEYKIVSDWIFYIKVVSLSGITLDYIDYTICDFDMTGISSQNTDLLYEEREKALKKIIPLYIPDFILNDYNYFRSIQYRNIYLEEKFGKLFHYSFTYFITRAINRILNLLDFKKYK
jgi:glycosyltransferase involved in cell wall biosynthesis